MGARSIERTARRGAAWALVVAVAAAGGACDGGGASRSAGGVAGGGTSQADEAPSALQASALAHDVIALAWTDNSTREIGTRIERHRGDGAWAAVGQVGPGVATYHDDGLLEATTYHYRVTAYDAAGDMGTSGEASATTPPCAWEGQLGGGGADRARRVAYDATFGLLHVAAYGESTLIPGVRPVGGQDAYLLTYRPDGQLVSHAHLGTAADDHAIGVAVDAAGDVALCGITEGDIGPGSNAGGQDGFVVLYDPSGTELWTRAFRSASDMRANAVAFDPTNGDLVVVGLVFGPDGTQDPFAVRLDRAGNEVWRWEPTQWGHCYARDVVVDDSGNAYVIGRAQFTMSGVTGPIPGSGDIFVAKLDPAGSLEWLHQYGTTRDDSAPHSGHDLPGGIAIDAAGDLYVAGLVQGDAAGAGSYQGPLVPFSDRWSHWGDVALYKLDPDGQVLWVEQIGTPEGDYPFAVAVADSGAVYVTGATRGTMPGARPGGSSGGDDIFIAAFDGSTGAITSVRQRGSAGDDQGRGLAIGGDGARYISGFTSGDLQSGGAGVGADDLFLLRICD